MGYFFNEIEKYWMVYNQTGNWMESGQRQIKIYGSNTDLLDFSNINPILKTEENM